MTDAKTHLLSVAMQDSKVNNRWLQAQIQSAIGDEIDKIVKHPRCTHNTFEVWTRVIKAMTEKKLTVEALSTALETSCNAIGTEDPFMIDKRNNILESVLSEVLVMVRSAMELPTTTVGKRVTRVLHRAVAAPPVLMSSSPVSPAHTSPTRRRRGTLSAAALVVTKKDNSSTYIVPVTTAEPLSIEASADMLRVSRTLKDMLAIMKVGGDDVPSFMDFFVSMFNVDFTHPRCVVYKEDERVRSGIVNVMDSAEEIDKYIFAAHDVHTIKQCPRCQMDVSDFQFDKRRLTYAVGALYFRTYGDCEELTALDDANLIRLMKNKAPRPNWLHNSVLDQVVRHSGNNGTRRLWSAHITSDRFRRTMALSKEACKAGVKIPNKGQKRERKVEG